MCDKCGDKPKEALESKIREFFVSERKIFLSTAIDNDVANRIISELLYLDSLSNEDITLIINSPGGVVTAGFAIIDTMRTIKSDVSTVVIGQAASMGALILACGTHGKRKASKLSEVMIHQPLISGHLQGVTSDIQIRADQINKKKRIINDMLSEATGHTFKKIEEDTDRDYFMDANESLMYNIIDEVI